MSKARDRVTKQKAEVLEAYKTLGTYTAACEKVGVTYVTFRQWTLEDPVFKSAVETADEMFGEFVERVAMEEGIRGKTVPVYYEGRRVDEYRERDPKVLLELLKVRNLKYRQASRMQNFNIKVLAIIDTLTTHFVDMVTERIKPACPHCHKALPTRTDLMAGLEELAQKFSSREVIAAMEEESNEIVPKRKDSKK